MIVKGMNSPSTCLVIPRKVISPQTFCWARKKKTCNRRTKLIYVAPRLYLSKNIASGIIKAQHSCIINNLMERKHSEGFFRIVSSGPSPSIFCTGHLSCPAKVHCQGHSFEWSTSAKYDGTLFVQFWTSGHTLGKIFLQYTVNIQCCAWLHLC